MISGKLDAGFSSALAKLVFCHQECNIKSHHQQMDAMPCQQECLLFAALKLILYLTNPGRKAFVWGYLYNCPAARQSMSPWACLPAWLPGGGGGGAGLSSRDSLQIRAEPGAAWPPVYVQPPPATPPSLTHCPPLSHGLTGHEPSPTVHTANLI